MTPIDPLDLITLAGAVVLAAVGGGALLKGVLGLAAHLRLPNLLQGNPT